MVGRLIPVLAPLAAASLATPAGSVPPVPVPTAEGPVTGAAAASDVAIFRGIPYAAPPTGAARWQPPRPPLRRTVALTADHFAPDCVSTRPSAESLAGGQSEDCLYLNVWTPGTTGAKRPVMVWIYGGAFLGGSPAVPRFDGTALAKKGVVVVTFAFRTGVFGFLTASALDDESPHHASGNYGLLDTVAALAWVRANIAAFGGDPANVTVFGQSSGSQMVHALTLSPLARGLFAKVIGESGAGFGAREPELLAAAEARTADFVTDLAPSLAELRAKPTADILAAVGPRKFEPVVDGWVMPADAHNLYARRDVADVPTLVGSNGDEAQLNPALTAATYRDRVREVFGARTAAVLADYPAADDAAAPAAQKRLFTTLLGDFNVGSWADGQVATGRAPVWQYRFVHGPPPGPPGPGGGPPPAGAAHGAEIPYVFANLDRVPRAWTPTDRRLADVMSSYWVNFATTGDPNGPGLPRWDRLSGSDPRVLVIGDVPAMAPRPDRAAIARLTDLFYAPGGVFRPSPAAAGSQ